MSWDDSVKGWFRLSPSPELLDIMYLTTSGTVHRRDLQWTQGFVVQLSEGTEVQLDDENRDFAMVPLDSIGGWLESHDTCALANVEKRVSSRGGDGDLASHSHFHSAAGASTESDFERGTLGELKADSLRRVHETLTRRRGRQGRGAAMEDL